MNDLLIGLGLMLSGPLLVGLLLGVDRRLTARMQNRVGPPLMQPFLDLAKLFGKQRSSLNQAQITFALVSLILQMAAWTIFALGGDVLVAFFVSGAGSLALVLGAFSVRSAYSQIGAQRELLQILAYEPVMLLAVVALAWHNGSFMANAQDQSLLLLMPLVVLSFIPVVLIKMQKSPFDLATAHQELMSGVYVEYSGPYLGLLKIANWFELALLFGIMSLFFWDASWGISLLGKLSIVLGIFFIAVLVDNSTARLTRWDMVKYTLTYGISLIGINLLLVFVYESGVLP